MARRIRALLWQPAAFAPYLSGLKIKKHESITFVHTAEKLAWFSFLITWHLIGEGDSSDIDRW